MNRAIICSIITVATMLATRATILNDPHLVALAIIIVQIGWLTFKLTEKERG